MDALTDAPHCLHQLIEDQARRTPRQSAVAFEGQQVSYAELDRRTSELADHLREWGAGPEERIVLFVERTLSTIVGLLGILKAGAAYVPVDPAYPQARVAFILEDAGACMVLTESTLVPRLPAQAPRSLCLDRPEWGSRGTQLRHPNSPTPENLAYVIYTSGSTGRPKGVGIEHRSIVNYVLGISQRLRFDPGMHHALVSTIAADLGNTVIFPALATGGCLHVISQERAESQALLSEYFTRHRIDVLKIAPSHLAALQDGKDPELVLPRRRLILGGEPSPLERIAELRAMAPACEIYNHYGPTETTVGVLTYRVDGRLPSTRTGTLPLGTALPNCNVHVLNTDGRPCSPGEQGELFIGGAGVARGYLNRPELTAERFVADPFDSSPGARLYRSGDLGRRLPDGSIEFCGRIDNQVKLAGHRVELGEIEQVLREHDGVRDAIVLAQEERSGERQLVAYVVAKRAHQPLWSHAAVHVLPDGAPVAHLNRHETDYIYNEIFALRAYLRHGITIREGDCIIDAGANIGMFTVFASRLARGLRILAFEPNPTAFGCLSANASAWGGDAVTCLPCGLSSEDRVADLTFFEGMSLLSGFYADAATERSVVETYVLNQQPVHSDNAQLPAEIGQLINGRLHASTIRARLRSLSSVIAEHALERIDLLKVNVEKSELDVLRGIAPPDWPRIHQMVIEVDRSANLEPITSLLGQHGFDVLVEQDPLLSKTELCYVYAVRPGEGRKLIRGQGADAHPLPGEGSCVLAPASLRRHLKERLPRHMVPQAFLLMERFPLMPNGKIDRLALPPAEAPQPSAGFVRPDTETERSLAAIWGELLQVETIGVHDDFFELGGESLTAMRMVARVRDALGVEIQLRNLFERPTVAGLAEIVDGLAWKQKSGLPPAGAGEREEMTL
jgi:iturin family lipopeptide synthetase A